MITLDAPRLDAYLARLGLDAPPSPTLESLDALIAAQLARIPFENIDPLLGRPVQIDIDAVFDKLVTRGRGGYCFELNTLLAAALTALGYTVTPLAARVRWGVANDVQTMASHMLLRVEVAHRSYLADVGFGAPSPFRSLPLSAPAASAFPYRLVPAPDDTTASTFHGQDLEVRGDQGWLKVYRFDLTPQPWIDFIARNWYICTHPDSPFTQRLMVARTDGDVRLTLANGELAERAADGTVHRQPLSTAGDVIDVLAARFHVALDADSRAGLERVLPALLGA
ncbi:arylamine N-acetyltransferase family protein [Cupriavidus pinatubonensis]|uniref:Arylamine N-acetyltransferase n=1 Tax=Cupriavidus pinatubonensis TaxID=248026 RepID=A0ABM8X6F8_9BURK|nr:arylamine N-acetyltransferase [Cupriavidus pinatubonensis]CAG9175527.1 Arylamine N-acetyltransferase [Cupriavidus pinatubonensis]